MWDTRTHTNSAKRTSAERAEDGRTRWTPNIQDTRCPRHGDTPCSCLEIPHLALYPLPGARHIGRDGSAKTAGVRPAQGLSAGGPTRSGFHAGPRSQPRAGKAEGASAV